MNDEVYEEPDFTVMPDEVAEKENEIYDLKCRLGRALAHNEILADRIQKAVAAMGAAEGIRYKFEAVRNALLS